MLTQVENKTTFAHGLDLVAEFPIRYLSPLQEEGIMHIQ